MRIIGRFAIAAVILLTIWFFISLPNAVPERKPDTIRIAHMNMLYTNTTVSRLVETLPRQQADVWVITEYTGDSLVRQWFPENGYRILVERPSHGTHGLLMAVRHSMSASGAVLPKPLKMHCVMPQGSIRVDTPSGPISIFGIHAPPPLWSCVAAYEPMHRFLSTMAKEGRLTRDLGVGKAGDRLILIGDFNMGSYDSRTDWYVRGGLLDAYLLHNWRPGPTWSPGTWFPSLIRIDYAWVSHHLQTSYAWHFRVPGSDHRGIAFDLITLNGN